jgi:hypothetical protein
MRKPRCGVTLCLAVNMTAWKKRRCVFITVELGFTTVRRFVPGPDHVVFMVVTVALGGPEKLSRYTDSLRAGRSGDRIPVGARFSVPFQTGPGAYPAS